MEGASNTETHEMPLKLTKLKKKKKHAFFKVEEIPVVEEPRIGEEAPSERSPSTPDFCSEMDFNFGKKKRKKKISLENEIKEHSDILPTMGDLSLSEKCMTDTEADYSYEYLLSRAFTLMREKNPGVDDLAQKKLIIKPPQVFRVGTKKTSLANFLEMCKVLRRVPQHVQSFLLVELGTNGSVDGNGQLIIKGTFQQKQMECVIRRYVKEYVTCHTCHSPDTVLLKETRLCFLQCETCGSRCSVATIKTGFQAVINKRAAMRAKEN